MTRTQVLEKCYRAKTLTEVKEAQAARSLGLTQHPDDAEIRHLGEMLSMTETALSMVGDELEAPPLPSNLLSSTPPIVKSAAR
jgi:hypothetical protein